MTKAIVAALLAAGSILPSVASAQDARQDRPDLTDAQRQARAERRAERQQAQQGDGGQQRAQQQQAQRADLSPEQRAERRQQRLERQATGGQAQRGDYRNDRNQNDMRDRRDGQYVNRDGGRVVNDGRYDRNRSGGAGWERGGNYDAYARDQRGGWDRRGGYDAPNYAARSSQRWSNEWRRDGRYDWNGYRSYNRQAFRLPRYYAPGGWGYGYRRFSIGARIAAPLFGENYWISDPWEYRLPPAYGPYRWVRYYDDAVMVDLRTGSVVDVIYDIFW